MRALSIRQPWAWAILNAGKRVENREWDRPPMSMIGQTFLIHAAKGCTLREWVAAREFMRNTGRRPDGRPLAGGLAGPAGDAIIPGPKFLPRSAIVGRARLVRAWTGADQTSPWAIPGALHLCLSDVERIDTPIPFKGAQGFFNVSDELLVGAAFEAVRT